MSKFKFIMLIVLRSPLATFWQIQIFPVQIQYKIPIVDLFPKCRIWQDSSVHKHTGIIMCLVGLDFEMYSSDCTYSWTIPKSLSLESLEAISTVKATWFGKSRARGLEYIFHCKILKFLPHNNQVHSFPPHCRVFPSIWLAATSDCSISSSPGTLLTHRWDTVLTA